ncbi:sensor histidine kinase [Anaeromicropila populeti]|uniref:GHKL domain-containing protein n=1 Tax=Anaeromicropila populeti TaxID=37658 RepID=A0A1I6LDC9_9FIRM|nr:sensor histidine kinase [Anaeromicropila populeti]SFS01427.1 GHKL domain-containing protein [Anaeromicropila populeti]
MIYFCYIASLIVYAIDPYISIKVLCQTFEKKSSNLRYYIGSGIGLYILVLIKQIVAFQNVPAIINMIFFPVLILYLICFCILLLKNKLWSKLFVIGLLFILSTVMDFLTVGSWLLFTNVPLEDMTNFGVINCLMTINARFLGLLIYKLIFIKYKDTGKNYIAIFKELLPVVLCNLILEIPVMALFNNMQLINYKISTLYGIMFGQIVIVLCVSIYMIMIHLKKQRNAMQMVLKMQQMEIELSSYQSIAETTRQVRQIRHDMKSHLFLTRSYIEKGELEMAIDYINNLYTIIQEADTTFCLDNLLLAAILSEKGKLAKTQSIRFDIRITVNNFQIEDRDLNCMLSNILDNAVEAQQFVPLEQRYIDLEMYHFSNRISISCENSMSKKPSFNTLGKLVSTKSEGFGEHGLGIDIIREIARKYHGFCTIDYTDTRFTIKVVYPIGEMRGDWNETDYTYC